MFDGLVNAAKETPSIRWRSRYLDLRLGVECGERQFIVGIDKGAVTVQEAPLSDDLTFTLSASADAWKKFKEAAPPPGFNDIMAMSSRGNLEVRGDMVAFQQHLLMISMLFEGLRAKGAAA